MLTITNDYHSEILYRATFSASSGLSVEHFQLLFPSKIFLFPQVNYTFLLVKSLPMSEYVGKASYTLGTGTNSLAPHFIFTCSCAIYRSLLGVVGLEDRDLSLTIDTEISKAFQCTLVLCLSELLG